MKERSFLDVQSLHVEARLMRWLKRNKWKAGIALAGLLLLLVLMVWVPVSAAGTYEGVSGLATLVTGMVQVTPTEDATVAALNKEKLEQEVQQLKEQNEPNLLEWLRTYGTILLSTLVVVIGGLIGLFRWFGDRRSEREKRAEERFQSAVLGLADEKEGAQIGAAILLRTFLRPGYEEFYIQVFDLAVAHLRRRNIHPDAPEPLDTLSEALITVFKESFPLARERITEENSQLSPVLVARGIQLDNAYLREADLQQVWMPQASLREADLREAKLNRAMLNQADLSGASLRGANLQKANLIEANLSGTELRRANLREAEFREASLRGADLRETHLEEALSLKNTDLRGVKGLTKDQLEACKAKGAIIDEDITASASQSPVSPPAPVQSNDA